MKTILMFTLILTSFCVSGFAQFSAPPPPFIYSPPDKNLIEKFVSDDFDFQIYFAGQPTISSNLAKNAKETTFATKLIDFKESVIVSEFKFNVENKIDANEIYEYVKSKYLFHPDNELAFEKNFELNGIKGKEFGVKLDYNYQIVRAFAVGNRIYELNTYVSNWHILNDNYKDKVLSFENETKRFFDSFKVDKVSVIKKSLTLKNSKKTVIKELVKKDKPSEYYSNKAKTFTSLDGGFEIGFTYKPIKKNTKAETIVGKVDFVLFTHNSGVATYQISYFDYPKIIKTEDLKAFAQAEKEKILDQSNIELIYENDISQKKIMGKEFIYLKNGKKFKVWLLYENQRMFRIALSQNRVSINIPEVILNHLEKENKRFFESFRLLKIL